MAGVDKRIRMDPLVTEPLEGNVSEALENVKKRKLRKLKEKRKCWRKMVAVATPPISRYDARKLLPRSSFMYSRDLRERMRPFWSLSKGEEEVTADCVRNMAEPLIHGERFAVHVWFCTRIDSGAFDELLHDHRCFLYSGRGFSDSLNVSLYALPVKVQKDFLAVIRPLCDTLIQNFRKIYVPILVDRFCPVPASFRSEETANAVASLQTPPIQVYLFLRRLLILAFPIDLWASSNLKSQILKKLKKYVFMGRTDVMRLGFLTSGVKISEVGWVKPLTLSMAKEEAVAKFLWWIFAAFLPSTLRSFFYITEMDHKPRLRVFYRKKVWRRLRSLAFSRYALSNNFVKLDSTEASARLTSGRSLGSASLRFIPKEKSLRPILSMKSADVSGCHGASSINQKLADAFRLLKFRKTENPSLVGFGVFGRSDFMKKFLDFRHGLLDDKGVLPRKFFFVKIDVNDCYQTIDQEKMCCILDEAISKRDDGLLVERKFNVSTMVGSRPKMNRFSTTLVQSAIGGTPAFEDLAHLCHYRDGFYGAIFEDACSSLDPMDPNKVRDLVKDHIRNTLLKVGPDYFLMSRGLAAGCVISALCCNYYYGHLERSLLPVLERSLIVREIDDYLLLTDDEDRAKAFLSTFLRGFPSYSMYVKKRKTLTNFPFSIRSYELEDVAFSTRTEPPAMSSFPCDQPRTDSLTPAWFPWCGFLFNESTLEVRLDFARYKPRDPKAMRQTVSIIFGNPWSRRNVLDTVRSNAKNLAWPLCFAPIANSRRIRMRNFYEFLILLFRKLYTLNTNSCPPNERLHADSEAFVELVETIGVVARARVEAVTRHTTRKAGRCSGLSLKRDAAVWLSLEAARSAFSPNRGQFYHCLKAVRRRQSRYASSMLRDICYIRSLSFL